MLSIAEGSLPFALFAQLRDNLMDGMSQSVSSSYAHGVSLTPLLGQTIGDNLRATVSRHGDSEALVVRSQSYRATYRQLWDAITDAARGLLALGVAPGERVGIWATNCYERVVVQYATARIGAILVNVNPAYQTNELEYVLRQSGISVLLHGRGFRNTVYAPMVETVRPRCPELRNIFPLDTAWDRLMQSGQTIRLAELEKRESELQCDDPINIQYTSGTTGSPKGATLTHHNILNNGYFIGLALGYTERDRVCIPVPLYHCFGMVLGNLACTATGACMVYPSECFQASAVLETIQRRALYVAVRRADDVPCRPRTSRLRALRLLLVAHRHHGRRPLPDRVDEASGRSPAHAAGGHRLRHDRNVTHLDPERPR